MFDSMGIYDVQYLDIIAYFLNQYLERQSNYEAILREFIPLEERILSRVKSESPRSSLSPGFGSPSVSSVGSRYSVVTSQSSWSNPTPKNIRSIGTEILQDYFSDEVLDLGYPIKAKCAVPPRILRADRVDEWKELQLNLVVRLTIGLLSHSPVLIIQNIIWVVQPIIIHSSDSMLMTKSVLIPVVSLKIKRLEGRNH